MFSNHYLYITIQLCNERTVLDFRVYPYGEINLNLDKRVFKEQFNDKIKI